MTYDLKIVNARLVDGTGTPARPGEIAVSGGRIAALGPTVAGAARRVIDARGEIAAPGFIDLHTHCLPARNENFLQAGVTLVVGGNCGFSVPEIGASAAACPGACGPNIAFLVGHNTVRLEAMGNVARAPSKAELARMKREVARAMAAGAAGFSTGLTYVPGNYADTAEVIELAGAAADAGGYYTSHMRDEGDGLLESVRETAGIGRVAGLPVHVSHLKVVGRKNWGLAEELLGLLDEYDRAGLDITQDQYPYTASCGRILLLFPQWAQEGGPAEMLARLSDRARRGKLADALCRRWDDYYGGDGRRIVISSAPDQAMCGRSIADLAARAGRANESAALAETVLEIVGRFPGQADVYCVFHGMSEDDLVAIMRHPRTATGSDAWAPKTPEEVPHPRAFGTCPRVLGRYARDQKLFPVEEAVRRMTGLPAARLGLTDRGVLREGAWADLVVFDPATVADRATFEAPRQYPIGISRVLVNGVPVIEHGRFQDVLPGCFVPRAGSGAGRAAGKSPARR